VLRPGFAFADTSLVLYFDVAAPGTADWASWRATVYDPQTQAAQESAPIAATDLPRCGTPRQYCRTFGAADGWALTDAHDYFVTVTVTLKDGTEVVSDPSATAKARATANPPALPDQQAAGCACGNVLAPTSVGQAVRGGGVNTGTGAFTFSSTDLRMSGFAVPFQDVRRYSSTNTGAGSLGLGWAWTYDVRVIPPAGPDPAVTVRAEDGAQVTYARNDDGSYRRPPGVRSNLSATDDGWRLATPDQITYTFDAGGRLTSIRNSRRQGATITYGASSWKITDASGRVVTVDLGADLLIRRVSLPDGRNVRYGYTDGRLTSATDAEGNTWEYRYSGGALTQVLDPHHRVQVTTGYDGGRVVSQTDALGNVTSFAWDAAKQEARTTDPDGVVYFDGYRGNVLVYSQNGNGDTTNQRYDQQVDPTLLVDAKGNQLVSGYDGAGNVTATIAPEPFSYTVSNTYDPHNNLTTHTDGLGHTATFGYTAFDELAKITNPGGDATILSVDDRGLVTAVTDPLGKKTTMAYDAFGNLTSQTTPLGEKAAFGYDQSGRPVTSTDPRGTAAGADADAFTTRYAYDNLDRLRRTHAPGKHDPSVTDYDDLGQLVRTRNPEGDTTTYQYLKVLGRTASVTDPNGRRTDYAYTAAGRRASVTDAAGDRTTFGYDGRGNLSTVVSPRGNANGANPAPFTTTYSYDFNSNLVRTRHPYPGGGFVTQDTGFDELNRAVTSTDGFGKTTVDRYDNNQNLVSTVDPLGQETSYDYDVNGRPRAITAPAGGSLHTDFDAAGNPVARTTATGGRTTWTYDDDGRVVTAVEPRGNVDGADAADYTTRYAYDPAGNLTTVTDALGHATTFDYDANNRVVGDVDRNGNRTAYGYDDADRLVKVTGPTSSRPTTSYKYDRAGHVVAKKDPNDHTSHFGYDVVGRVASVTDPLGRTGTYAYDAESNMTRYTAPGKGDEAARSIVNSYDILNRQVGQDQGSGALIYAYGYDAKNRRTSLADASGLRTQTYDDVDRLTKVSRGDRTFAYGYDGNGNVTSRTWPDGTQITATFDAADRMTDLTARGGVAGSQGQTYAFGYDPAGRPTRTTLPAATGTTTARTYDRAGRLTDLDTTAGSKVVARYQIDRDPVGNPATVTTTRGDAAQAVAYAYDESNRVTASCYGVRTCEGQPTDAVTYRYDDVGNRRSQTLTGSAGSGTTKYSYDAADQLTEAKTASPDAAGHHESTVTFGYDSQGNLIRSGSDTFAYNLDHTMASATVAGKTVGFSYDGQGLQLDAISGSGTEVTSRARQYDINGTLPQLALETTDKGATSSTRGFLNDQGQLPLATLVDGEVNSFAPDWLGGVADVLGPDGAPLAAYDFDPYGQPRTNGTAAGVGAAGSDNPVKFAGGYQDPQLGSQYSFPARAYDPGTGRFGGVDLATRPLRAPASSTYGYVEGRPTVFRDPSGASANADHDEAQALALEQLDALYGSFNVYADDVPGRQILQGRAGRICPPTVNPMPGDPATGCPDIIARLGAETFVWDVKPASDQLSSIKPGLLVRGIANADQIARYVRSLVGPQYPNARTGDNISPASRTSADGSTLTIFSGADWSRYARRGARPAQNSSGIIYYLRTFPPRVPVGRPTAQPNDKTTQQPREEPTARPADRPVQQPTDSPVVSDVGTDILVGVAVVAVVVLVIVLLPEEIVVGAGAAVVGLFSWAFA
jgi:RHS repeat-associated protein